MFSRREAAQSVSFDRTWVDQVIAACDPVFAAAEVGFTRQLVHDADGVVCGLLWEADPSRFADRYPDNEIVEAYGPEQWPDVACVDFWVHFEADRDRVKLDFEGWMLPALYLDVCGHGARDGADIANTAARVLAVPPPRT